MDILETIGNLFVEKSPYIFGKHYKNTPDPYTDKYNYYPIFIICSNCGTRHKYYISFGIKADYIHPYMECVNCHCYLQHCLIRYVGGAKGRFK